MATTIPSLQVIPPPAEKRHGPRIQTYHCLCTHLVLASTHTLSTLPRRTSPSLDKALTLPLPPPPFQSTSDSESSDTSSASSGSETEQPAAPQKKRKRRKDKNALGYSLILAMTLDRKPLMVRRQDGFEKRHLWRCGRCRLVVGYQLDNVHFTDGSAGFARATVAKGGHSEAEGEDGDPRDRAKVVYLLPGGLLSTEEMKAAKAMDKEVELSGE